MLVKDIRQILIFVICHQHHHHHSRNIFCFHRYGWCWRHIAKTNIWCTSLASTDWWRCRRQAPDKLIQSLCKTKLENGTKPLTNASRESFFENFLCKNAISYFFSSLVNSLAIIDHPMRCRYVYCNVYTPTNTCAVYDIF